jgi:A/G-specific adenine glycosylase
MKKPDNPELRFGSAYRKEGLSLRRVALFRKMIHDHYSTEGRSLPWRRTRNPYRILVSEVMLQQTQVVRVLDKYRFFLKAFPDFHALARASLADVLGVWQGLGYNGRAKALKKTAEVVVSDFGGKLPLTTDALIKFPGIGKYSAGAIYTFATGKPSLFIETNIRRVYIHFFFGDKQGVGDAEIIPLIEKTMDRKNPREWYYALMDYGVKLKQEVENPNRRSSSYRKQSPFRGSVRQLRGAILRTLLKSARMTKSQIAKKVVGYTGDVDALLHDLVKEGFLERKGGRFGIRQGK